MPEPHVIALVITLAIIAVLFVLMRKGLVWLDGKLHSLRPALPTPAGAGSATFYSPERAVVPGIEVRYPSRAISGEDAVAAWEQAKTEGIGIPVIVADLPDDGVWHLTQQPDDVLEAAARIDRPLPLLPIDREAKPWPENVVPQDGSTVVRKWENGAMRFLPRVHIVSVPARDATDLPAYLGLGGWNDCPAAERMVAALRQWQKEYGAELVAISRDTMDIRVKRRPATREEALKLARQQAVFCSDVVENPDDMLEELAATLMISDWWFFWWD